MKTEYILYDPAIWKAGDGGILDCDLPYCDYARKRGIPLYTEEELLKLDAIGALDGLSNADRETLFRESRA
jgi:hypothetical protein